MATLHEYIQGDWPEYHLTYRIHATRRMFQRGITDAEVESILIGGEVIEAYADDFPLPSYLLCGWTTENRPLHIVVGIDTMERNLVVITAYEPEIMLWEENFTRRKR